MTGTTMTASPRWLSAGEVNAVDQRAVEGEIGDEADQRRQDARREGGEDGHANRQG